MIKVGAGDFEISGGLTAGLILCVDDDLALLAISRIEAALFVSLSVGAIKNLVPTLEKAIALFYRQTLSNLIHSQAGQLTFSGSLLSV